MSKRITAFLVIITGLFIVISILIKNEISSYLPYVSLISLSIAIHRLTKDAYEKRAKQKEIVELSVKPVMAPLITSLKANLNENLKITQIDELKKAVEHKTHDEKDLISVIVFLANKYAELLNIDEKYRKAFSLALAYQLTTSHDINNGDASREIDGAITKNQVIKCGDEIWELTQHDIDWYAKFSEATNLISHTLVMSFQEVRDHDPIKIQNERNEINTQSQEALKYLKDKDEKFQKLMTLIMKRIPNIDFLKILVSLRTSIVLISRQGRSSVSDRQESKSSHDTGAKYLTQVFYEMGLNRVRLNNSVDFVFLSDIIPTGSDYRYFNLQFWGQQIAKKADELRQNDESGHDRKFNFVVLKSSLDELRSFGDELGGESRIKIPPAMLSSLGAKEMNMSMLITIGKMLRQLQSTSLAEFIDKNLEYLDGITSETIAKTLSEALMKTYNKTDWRISDFKKNNIKKEQLMTLGISEEQANNILTESSTIAHALSLI